MADLCQSLYSSTICPTASIVVVFPENFLTLKYSQLLWPKLNYAQLGSK